MAQSDRLANAPQSGHLDVGRIYHVIVRLSLEPDRHFRHMPECSAFPKDSRIWKRKTKGTGVELIVL